MSNYDTGTAITIASTSGIAGTILGALVPLVPAFLPATFVMLVVWRRVVLSVLAGAATLVISPAYTTMSLPEVWSAALASAEEGWQLVQTGQWQIIWRDWQLAVIVAAFGVFVALWDPPRWIRRLRPVTARNPEIARRQRRRPGYGATLFLHYLARLSVAALIAPIGAFSILLVQPVFRVPTDVNTLFNVVRQPWVPTEEITVESGESLIGYTLSTKDGWFVVLVEDDRRIMYVPADQVLERRACALTTDLTTFERLPLWRPPVEQLPTSGQSARQSPACGPAPPSRCCASQQVGPGGAGIAVPV